jgi:hypothetical protein
MVVLVLVIRDLLYLRITLLLDIGEIMPPTNPRHSSQKQAPNPPVQVNPNPPVQDQNEPVQGTVNLPVQDQNEPTQGLPGENIQTHQPGTSRPDQPAARVISDSNDPNAPTLTPEQIAANEAERERQLREETTHKEVEEQIPRKPGVIGVVDTKRQLVPKAEMPKESDETPKMAKRNWSEGDRNEVMQVESSPTPPYVASQNYQGQPPPPTPGHGEPIFAVPKRDGNGNIMRDEEGNILYITPGVLDESKTPVPVGPPIEAKQNKAGMLSRNRLSGPRDRMQIYEIGLRDCPTLRIQAGDRLEAIQIYNNHCGIIKTENQHSITAIT